MPENIFKAVVILIWLLSGTIIFGYLIMDSTYTNALIFLLLFYALPVTAYMLYKKKKL